MTELVSDLQTWPDFPFKVPPHVEVRMEPASDFVVLWSPDRQKNVAVKLDELNQSNIDLALGLLEWI